MGSSPSSQNGLKAARSGAKRVAIGGTAMKNGRKKEEEYFFEYDNVYNLEHDELRAESDSDTSVWYS